MIYQESLKVPSGTTAASPEEVTLGLSRGTITEVTIEFPAGCAGLVGFRVKRGLFQLWPIVADEWFVTDNFVIKFPEHFVLWQQPLQVELQGYNTDDTYDHTIKVQIAVEEYVPDPMAQVAAIMARREMEEAPVTAKDFADLREGLREMYALLYNIHASDFPTLFQYLDQLRGS